MRDVGFSFCFYDIVSRCSTFFNFSKSENPKLLSFCCIKDARYIGLIYFDFSKQFLRYLHGK